MDLPQRLAHMAWLLLSPSGRVGRQVFCLSWLSWLFWLMLASLLIARLFGTLEDEGRFGAWLLAFFLFLPVAVFSLLMLTVKRLHDMGWPGILSVLILIPAISAFSLAAFCFWPSTVGPNAYGARSNWPQ